MEKIHGNMHVFVLSCKFLTCKHKNMRVSYMYIQYRSSFQSSTLIGRAVTRSQTSLGVRARFRLGFRAGYDVF